MSENVVRFLCLAIVACSLRASPASAGPSFAPLNSVSPAYYIPVTLTNSQGGATSANLQVKVTINSNTNSAKYASDLRNVNWQDGNGNVLASWLESGFTNTSTASVYWINLGSNTIAGSGGTRVIYQVLYATGTIALDGVTTGAEPSFTGTYGQYDNGSTVFTAPYQNFAGTSVPAGWQTTIFGGGTVTFNNGITMTTSGVGTRATHVQTTSAFNVPIIETKMVTIGPHDSTGAAPSLVYSLGAITSSGGDYGMTNTYRYDDWKYDGATRIVKNVSVTGAEVGQVADGWGNTGIWTATWNATGSQKFEIDYVSKVTGSDTSHTKGATYLAISAVQGGVCTSKWFRARNYPPSGVLPSAVAAAVVRMTNSGFIHNPQ